MGPPALRTTLPDVLGDHRALEALHFVPWGHGGGYSILYIYIAYYTII